MFFNLWKKVKIFRDKKRDEVGLGEDIWYRKKWFFKVGIYLEILFSFGSLGVWETEIFFWGELKSDLYF